MAAADSFEDTRRARRAWIREHHPDRGGDPERFAEGLRRLAGGQPASSRPLVYRTRPIRRALRKLRRATVRRLRQRSGSHRVR
ncbi:MAG: hypothetical protein M3Y77_03580 [Actinomycetota bacterium]|nr:hypothetical protein [Actinomycetota bacterium]